jgi:hypothetical protein
VTISRKHLLLVAAAVSSWVGASFACSSSTGSGSDCFSPVEGPSGPSCAGFTVGLSCPVDLQPYYSCVCTATSKTDQEWVCMPSGTGGASGGASGSGGSGGLGTGGVGGAGETGVPDAGDGAVEAGTGDEGGPEAGDGG